MTSLVLDMAGYAAMTRECKRVVVLVDHCQPWAPVEVFCCQAVLEYAIHELEYSFKYNYNAFWLIYSTIPPIVIDTISKTALGLSGLFVLFMMLISTIKPSAREYLW